MIDTSDMTSTWNSLKWLIIEFSSVENKRPPKTTIEDKKTKKKKKPTIIAEYTSSESENSDEEDTVDDIDELLNEVLDEKEKTDPKVPSIDSYPLFEADCRAAIARLTDLGDKSIDICKLRIQLEVGNRHFSCKINRTIFSTLDTSWRLSCWSSNKILCR